MRTRRRAKYTWFPNIGFQGDELRHDFAGFPFSFNCPLATGETGSVAIFDLIPDTPDLEPSTTADNLVDFIGNEYILKRIVGKCFIWGASSAPTGPTDIVVSAGFFVSRFAADAPQLPIGATGAAAEIQYAPLNNNCIREPWIWRRTWKIQNPGIPVPTGILGTFNGGSVSDGPHIDAKSARRIRSDERIFFAVQAGNISAADAASGYQLDGFLDYRILGALRKAKNRSAF